MRKEAGPMRVRMRDAVLGMFEGIEGGVRRGQIVDVPDQNALQYVANGLAEAELEGPIGRAYEPATPELMIELRAKIEPPKRPLDALRAKSKASRPKTTAEKLAEIPW